MTAAEGRLVTVGQNLAQKRQASWADAVRLIAARKLRRCCSGAIADKIYVFC
jgi:hypothetical protein